MIAYTLYFVSAPERCGLEHLIERLDEVERWDRVLSAGEQQRVAFARPISLLRQIAMVLQPPLIFPISVRDNLSYRRPDATQEEIEAAARIANIHAMITALPQSCDTLISESGAHPIGGREAAADDRVLLRDAPILILDKPTSARDGVIVEHGTFADLPQETTVQQPARRRVSPCLWLSTFRVWRGQAVANIVIIDISYIHRLTTHHERRRDD